MQNMDFFKAKRFDMIKFDIVFDEDPPEGVEFRDNKIFVNTKDSGVYQRFY
jgi:hypothetical protein